MRISDAEVKRILSNPDSSVVEAIVKIEEARQREEDQHLVQDLTSTVAALPDREELIADLRARIEAGTYHVTADAIIDGMVRRAIADQVR